jgi:hypothetical protein
MRVRRRLASPRAVRRPGPSEPRRSPERASRYDTDRNVYCDEDVSNTAELTKINQSESHPATPAGRGTHHAPSLVQLWRSAAPTTRLDTHGMGGGRTWEGGRRNTMASTVTTTATLPPQPDPANTTMAAAEEQIRERRVWGEAQRTRRAPRDLDRPDRHAPAPFCARRARVLSLLMALDMALASTRARGTW